MKARKRKKERERERERLDKEIFLAQCFSLPKVRVLIHQTLIIRRSKDY